MIKGILFDLDGTLINSMYAHYDAWKIALKIHGIDLAKDKYFAMEGMSMHEIALNLLKERYNSFEINDLLINLVVQKKKETISENRIKIEIYPGVMEVIDMLIKKKFKIGLVTASHLDQLNNLMDASLLDKFNHIVTGDMVEKGKPDPESYLKGIFGLKLKREECIAVENAPLGILSAKAAGLYSIGICSTLEAIHLIDADETVSEFKDLMNTTSFKSIFNS